MIIWQYVKLPFKSHKKRDYVRSKKTESMKRLTKKCIGIAANEFGDTEEVKYTD